MTRLRVRPSRRPLMGSVRVPGDKSIGHRALLFSALAEGRSLVSGLADGEDNRRTRTALEALGVAIAEAGPGQLSIEGRGLAGLRAATAPLDCGNAGTTLRLLAGLLSGQRFSSLLVGDRYLTARPMRRVVEPLRRMGAKIGGQPGAASEETYPPLTIGPRDLGEPLQGIDWRSPVASAQVKSALLIAALFAEGVTAVSEPERSRDHTERLLEALGAPLTRRGLSVSIDTRGWSGQLAAGTRSVPGDLSSAAFLLGAAALVPGSDVVVTGVGLNPTRTGFVDVLGQMGAAITVSGERTIDGEPVGELRCRGGELVGTRIAGALALRAIDELPLLAAVAACAVGETEIADAAELRVKESDRIRATVALLRAFAVEADERPDGLVVQGGPRRAALVTSHGDHRIAMAAAVLALTAAAESRIDDARNIATSFPTFVSTLRELGAEISVE